MITRRHVFFAGAAGLATLVLGRLTWPHAAKAAKTYEVTHTDAEWQKMLSPDAYQVLRHEGTERPFSSPLNNEHHAGTFACAGATCRSIRRRPSSTAAPAGRAFGRHSTMRSRKRATVPTAWSAPRYRAGAAAVISTRRRPSSTAAPVGRAFGRRSTMRSRKRATVPTAWSAPLCLAGAAAATSAMYSTTAPSPRGCATA